MRTRSIAILVAHSLFDFFFFIRAILRQLIDYFSSPQLKIEGHIDPVKQYIQSNKTRFLLNFEKDKGELDHFNANIDPIFYKKKEYDEFLKNDTSLEIVWKRRILYQSTPRGNIAMYYDPYKLGFSYYCDTNIAYDILNAAAMKYVIMFRCIDFFVDESVIPDTHCSPFIKIHLIDEPKKKEEETKNNYKTPNIKDSHFAKFKTYNDVTSKVVLPNNIITLESESKKKMKIGEKNKFIHLGKICNFQFSQPFPKKRKMMKPFTSNLMSDIQQDSNAQLQCLSYKEFKRLQSVPTVTTTVTVDPVVPTVAVTTDVPTDPADTVSTYYSLYAT